MKYYNYILILLCAGSLLFLTNCGKHEAEGRTIGALAGATIGTTLAGHHNKGDGAVLGALIGGYVGGEYGRAHDEDDKDQEHESRVRRLRTENNDLKEQLTKYCSNCSRKVRIQGAQSCPRCGDSLIHEKFCGRCRTKFNPETGYKYCPYCTVKVTLRGR